MKHVFNAIKGVIQWYQLGVQLNVDSCRLDVIKANHPNDVEGAKMGLITEWLNNDPDKSWDKLASALRQIGHINLSDKISAHGQGMLSSFVCHVLIHNLKYIIIYFFMLMLCFVVYILCVYKL